MNADSYIFSNKNYRVIEKLYKYASLGTLNKIKEELKKIQGRLTSEREDNNTLSSEHTLSTYTSFDNSFTKVSPSVPESILGNSIIQFFIILPIALLLWISFSFHSEYNSYFNMLNVIDNFEKTANVSCPVIAATNCSSTPCVGFSKDNSTCDFNGIHFPKDQFMNSIVFPFVLSSLSLIFLPLLCVCHFFLLKNEGKSGCSGSFKLLIFVNMVLFYLSPLFIRLLNRNTGGSFACSARCGGPLDLNTVTKNIISGFLGPMDKLSPFVLGIFIPVLYFLIHPIWIRNLKNYVSLSRYFKIFQSDRTAIEEINDEDKNLLQSQGDAGYGAFKMVRDRIFSEVNSTDDENVYELVGSINDDNTDEPDEVFRNQHS